MKAVMSDSLRKTLKRTRRYRGMRALMSIANTETMVWEYFDGDEYKINLWFNTDNPALGLVSPMFMIEIGMEKKLEKWVKAQINGDICL